VILDYRVRGFTRDVRGKKHFIDHRIDSIQNFLSRDTREQYQMIDVNVYQENMFHTKMMLKEIDLDDYLFGVGKEAMSAAEQRKIRTQVTKEMLEMFYGRNMSRSRKLK
jgi:S-adenosylmethionine decarboxylase